MMSPDNADRTGSIVAQGRTLRLVASSRFQSGVQLRFLQETAKCYAPEARKNEQSYGSARNLILPDNGASRAGGMITPMSPTARPMPH